MGTCRCLSFFCYQRMLGAFNKCLCVSAWWMNWAYNFNFLSLLCLHIQKKKEEWKRETTIPMNNQKLKKKKYSKMMCLTNISIWKALISLKFSLHCCLCRSVCILIFFCISLFTPRKKCLLLLIFFSDDEMLRGKKKVIMRMKIFFFPFSNWI